MALALGVLGVGVIASAVVRGLGGTSLGAVTLSPRNAAKAAELQRDFPEVGFFLGNAFAFVCPSSVLVLVLCVSGVFEGFPRFLLPVVNQKKHPASVLARAHVERCPVSFL